VTAATELQDDRVMATDAVRVVVLDSNLDRRARLRSLLAEAGVTTAGDAGHGIEGLNLVQETHPDAVLVALDDRSPRALRTIEALTEQSSSPPVLGYARGVSSMREAMVAGARDYLALPMSAGELRRSLHLVLAQEGRRRAALGGTGDSPAPTRVGEVITVFGAKGGVGKTTIASNLAVSLARETGQSVALVDLDTRFGDAALTLDMPAEASMTELVRDLSQITRDQVRSYLTEHHASGVMLLPAPPNPADWSEIGAPEVEAVIALVASAFDYVVIDTPGTFNDMVASAIERASAVLIVTSLDVVSVKDTWLALDMLASWGVPEDRLKLVTNRMSPHSVVSEADIAGMLGRVSLTAFPYDPAVIRATAIAQPVVLARPQSPFSRRLTALALSLAGVEPSQKRGLFGRFRRGSGVNE